VKTQTGAPPAHPIDNEIPGIVNIRSDQPPGIDVPTLKEESSSSKTAKLNLGGIIALGVFGGFVFLAAVITTIVILVRRTQNARRHSPDSDTDSSSSETGGGGGLNKYYKQAWENLRETNRRSSKGNFRSTLGEGMRDGSEMIVSDAFAKPGGEKKRHHHHHHHHSYKHRQHH
jgi:hypothetical protein